MQTKIQIDELLLAFVSMGEVFLSMWPHQVVLGNFFQDVENFKMETGILNFSQVKAALGVPREYVCFLLFFSISI